MTFVGFEKMTLLNGLKQLLQIGSDEMMLVC